MDFTNFWFDEGPGGSGDPGDPIGQSLRGRGPGTGRLARTPASAGNRQTYTISFWIKGAQGNPGRAIYAAERFQANTGGTNGRFEGNAGAHDPATNFFWNTQSVLFRDPSAWYHWVFVGDTTNATEADRIRFYINGERITISGTNLIGQNYNTGWNAAVTTTIFDYADPSDAGNANFQGYLADFYNIDGQALEPTAFGRYNEQGVWVPREVDFTPPGLMFSDSCAGYVQPFNATSTEQSYELAGPAGLFDGSLSTNCRAPGAGFVNVNFNPALTGVTGLRLNVGYHEQILINGTVVVDNGADNSSPNSWVDLTSFIPTDGEITQLAYGDASTSSNSARASAIEVTDANGTRILTDPFIWSTDVTVSPAVGNWSGGGGPQNMFSNPPDVENVFTVTTDSADSFIEWDAGGLNWNNTIEIYSFQGSSVDVLINGTDTGINPTGSTWTTVATGGGTLNTLRLQNNNSGGSQVTSCSGIRIDGQILVNGVNNSYGANGFHLDFADPNDLGADRSGNSNDFTATGFVTDLPGQWSPGLSASSNDTYQTAASGNRTAAVTNPANAFNGVANNGAYTGSANQYMYWVPPTPLTGVTSLGLGSAGSPINYQGLYINGVDTGLGFDNPGGNAVIDISAAIPADGVISEIAFFTNAGGNTQLNSVEVNGQILVDNTGTDYDLMQDSPTQNWTTLNSIRTWTEGNPTVTEANLKVGSATAADKISIQGTQSASSGKWYYEVINQASGTININAGWAATYYEGLFNTDQPNVYTKAIQQNQNMMVALDLENGFMWFGFDGVWDGGTTLAEIEAGDGTNAEHNGVNGNLAPCFIDQATSYSGFGWFNFGQRPFLYTPPAGFKALQTQNMPAAPIANGRDHFQAITGPGFTSNPPAGTIAAGVTFTGNAVSGFPLIQGFNGNEADYTYAGPAAGTCTATFDPPIPGNAFQILLNIYGTTPFLVNGVDQGLGRVDGQYRTVTVSGNELRTLQWSSDGAGGNDGFAAIQVDQGSGFQTVFAAGILNVAQQTFPNGLWWIKDRVNSNNHQLVDSVRGGNLAIRANTAEAETAYVAPSGNSVAWCWKAGESSVTDNTGSIESQVCVNEEAGFSIVQWTGNGGFESIGHGLGKRPGLVITRTRAADHWIVGHDSITTLSNGGAPSQWVDSNTFLGTNWSNGLILNSSNAATNYVASSGINISGDAMMAYVWAPIPGYSAFGIYSGNSDANGPFIYTGFRPAVVLIKSTNTANNWIIRDSTRSPHNPVETYNYITTASEATGRDVDYLSNGFKPRHSGAVDNTSGTEFIWCAWAENPFSSPVTAR